MAYIDDNNDLTAGKGKDPIEELDAELDRLMAELKEMEQSAEKAPPADEPVKIEQEMPGAEQPVPEKPPKKNKKAGKIVLITLVCVVVIGGIAALIRGISSLLSSKLSDHIGGSATVETVAFTDSELGEITVKKVEGAELNTYDPAFLQNNANGYYEYVVDGKVTSEVGVDLAEYQGDVDFSAVKASGVDYVILRIGGRYYSDEGALYEDGRFDSYYEQAKNAGLKVGAYFFSQAASRADAIEEAQFVLEKLDGRSLDYPVAFDWEKIEDDAARTDNLTGGEITDVAKAFCDTINSAGYKSIIYANTSLMLQSYDFETMKDYDFWLADYREFPNMYYNFIMWQYATDGSVSGIDGAADLNICFKPNN